MPLRILKLAVSASASDMTVTPVVQRFFHTVPTQVTEGTHIIPVEDFETDAGDAATEFPELATDNSYYNVYINGVMQMGNLTTYVPGGSGTGQVSIVVGEEETIEPGTPIVLEVVNFEPDGNIEVIT